MHRLSSVVRLTSAAGLSAVFVFACGGGSQESSLVLTPQAEPATTSSDPLNPGGVMDPANPTDPNATPTVGVTIQMEDPNAEPETFDEADSCAGDTDTAAPAPAILELVIDTSGSMNDPPSGDPMNAMGEPTKWEITRDALLAAMDQLGPSVAVGITYFPGGGGFGGGFGGGGGGGGGDCDLSVAVDIDSLGDAGSAQRNSISNSLGSRNPNGFTPTHSALAFGVDTVTAYQGDGDRFIVLITDGRPTRDFDCNDLGMDADIMEISQPIIDESAAAFLGDPQVRTFVIGSPGSEDAAEALSRIATQGGTPVSPTCVDTGPEYCHFDMTTQPDFAAALAQALSDIVGQIASCEFSLPDPPDGEELDLGLVNVNIVDSAGGSTIVPKSPAGSGCADGWDFSADGSQIVLCPSTCDSYSAMPSASVAVQFGCLTVEGPPQ